MFTCLLSYIPVSLLCFPGCTSSITVFFYFILQLPHELCIILSVAIYMCKRSCWTTTELQTLFIRDTKQHTEAAIVAMYILLHMV